MKLTNRLTELIIKQAKTKEKQYKLTDGEGMFLRVYPNGSKYWQLHWLMKMRKKKCEREVSNSKKLLKSGI